MDFERDIKDHKMTVEMDNGVFRSVFFGEQGNSCFHFRLTTWPGYLCFSGDMGTFVFSRLRDMFEFFRCDRVNLPYWAEKVEAASEGEGVMEYNPDLLKATLIDYFKDNENKAEILETLEPYFEDRCSSGEMFSRIYECEGIGDFLIDLSPACYKEYTHRYKWCCAALIWAIGVYDSEKELAA